MKRLPFLLLCACAAEPNAVSPTASADVTVPPPASTITAAPRAKASAAKPTSECYAEPVAFSDPKLAPKLLASDPVITLAQCESSPQRAECRYAVARAFFEANRFERAAPLFLDVALDPSSGDAGAYAAQLGLESLNVLGSRTEPTRASCYEEMTTVLPKLVGAICTRAPRSGADEACEIFRRIGMDIERLQAEAVVREADADPSHAPERYERAGDKYLALARSQCVPKKGAQPGSSHCDEIVYNAYRAFKAAKNDAKAVEARAFLLDPKNGLHKTELAKKVAKEP